MFCPIKIVMFVYSRFQNLTIKSKLTKVNTMKNFIILCVLSFFTLSSAVAQVDAKSGKEMKINMMQNTTGPVMSFEADEVDYGTIEQHSEPLRVLKFTNTGTEPLVIKNARGSCGCTVPKWQKEPIAPGETSELEVRYATNRLGKINKKITITTNEGGEPHVIRVVGEVLEKQEEKAAPVKATSLLKGGN